MSKPRKKPQAGKKKMVKKECKKAWKAERHEINGKWYKVQVLRGCEKCPDLQNCEKMEAIATIAANNALGKVNKIINKTVKRRASQ